MAEPNETYAVHLLDTDDPMEALRDMERQINEQNYRMAEAFSEAFIYGGIGCIDNATATTITTAEVKYKFTEFDTNHATNGMIADHTQNHIEVESDGIYMIMGSVTVQSPGGGGFTLELEVMKNNGAALIGQCHVDRDLSGGGSELGSMSLCSMGKLAKGDTIELWAENETGTENPTLEDVSLCVIKISNEAAG